MMAKSDSLSHLLMKNFDALKLLPDVLNVLLDPTKKIIDDTCVEKLLSWMTELASSPETLKILLDGKMDIIGFLQKSLNPACNPLALIFALRFAAVLLNALIGCPVKSLICEHSSEVVGACSLDARADFTCLCVISDAVEHLLIGSCKLPYWHKASIRSAWFASARALIGTRCPSEITQRLGILDIALRSLDDGCLFVVSASQQFIADWIVTTYKCCNGNNGHHSTGRLPHSENRDQEASGGSRIQHPICPQDYTEKPQESALEKNSLDHLTENSVKTQNCNCDSNLQKGLQQLAAMVTPVRLAHQQSFGISNSQIKQRTTAIGVLIKLIESWPVTAHAIFADISMLTILSEHLECKTHVSFDMCRSIVEFVSEFLQSLDSKYDSESAVVAAVVDLPMKLMNIKQFTLAIQLASNLYCTQQLSKLKANISQLQPQSDACADLLKLVMLPLDCLMSQIELQTTTSVSASSANKEYLLEEMTSHKCQCITLTCHSLSAMEKIVAKGVFPVFSGHTSLVDYMTSILSLTLGQRSQDVIKDSLRCHLRGSLKVTKAVLSLAMATLASPNECTSNFKLTETSLRRLLLQLTEVLNNPESDFHVIAKCLDVVAQLFCIYCVELKDNVDLTTLLGETLTKRSCDPRWAVRDSVVCFLQQLLQSSAGVLCDWFKCHSLHLQVLECVDDGESYVRASALSALVDVSKQQELWADLLQQTGKTEFALVEGFIDYMLADNQGFTRRATVHTYTKWLTVFPWLQVGFPGKGHGLPGDVTMNRQHRKNSEEANMSLDGISVANRIRNAIYAAMFDLDWEVKLGALEFWQTIIETYLPIRNDSALPDEANRDREQDNIEEQNNLHEVGNGSKIPAKSMLNLMQFLKAEGFICRLAEVLKDEDRTVAVRACQMLLGIDNLLLSETARNLMNDSQSDVAKFMKETAEELRGMKLQEVLEQKTQVIDGYEQHPVSLLQDILAGTEENSVNVQDCY